MRGTDPTTLYYNIKLDVCRYRVRAHACMFLCVSNARSYTNKTVQAQEMANESLQKLAHAINRDFFSFKD